MVGPVPVAAYTPFLLGEITRREETPVAPFPPPEKPRPRPSVGVPGRVTDTDGGRPPVGPRDEATATWPVLPPLRP